MLRPFIELAAAALLAQAAAAPPPEGERGQPPIHVEAAVASWDVPAGEALLKGGVLLRRGSLTLRAPEARYRPATGRVEMEDGALLVEGARAIVARALRGEVGGAYEVEDPAVYYVDDAAALAAATTPEEAGRVTPRRLTLRAERAVGAGDGGITLSRARGTLCTPREGEAPPWEIRAARADVRPGERAILTWPVLWVTPRFLFVERPVPVLTFPWLWVPLGERQSGLLLPELTSTGSSGITVTEPLFLTFGESADATISAGWAFGPPRADVRAGRAAVRGFAGGLELRWAPAIDAEGRLEVDLLADLDAEPGGTDGARVGVRGRHAQRVGRGGDLRVELDLAGDPLHARDFSSDLLQRDATYRRSALRLSWRGEDVGIDASGAWLLPLAADASLAGVPGLSFGLFGAALPTFHRGPALAATLLPAPSPGGLLASARAELARFGPAKGVTNDAGEDGLAPGDLGWGFAPGEPGQLDGRWQPGERLAATRATLRAEIARPLVLGRALRLAPFLRGAANGYAFDAAVAPLANAWAVAGAVIESELARRFGALRHAIVPRLAWRAGTGVAGGALPAFAYDGWDRAAEVPAGAGAAFGGARVLSAAPLGAFHQGRASVETRLDGPKGELVRLEVGQDFDLRSGEASESFATLHAAAGAVTADGAVRFAGFARRLPLATDAARRRDEWTEVRGAVRYATPRGLDLHAGLRSVGAGGSASDGDGFDALFDPRPTALPMSAQAGAGFRIPVGPATLGYELLFPPRGVTVAACDTSLDPGATRHLDALHVQQQTASFVWDSPCRCFRLTAQIRFNDCDGYDPRRAGFSVGIDLSPKAPLGALR